MREYVQCESVYTMPFNNLSVVLIFRTWYLNNCIHSVLDICIVSDTYRCTQSLTI